MSKIIESDGNLNKKNLEAFCVTVFLGGICFGVGYNLSEILVKILFRPKPKKIVLDFPNYVPRSYGDLLRSPRSYEGSFVDQIGTYTLPTSINSINYAWEINKK